MRRVLLFIALALVASACQVGVNPQAGCTPAADGNPFGTDGDQVLFCENGRWVPMMTVDQYVVLLIDTAQKGDISINYPGGR